MTLVMALHGEKSIWLCSDRRLTYPTKVRDDGCKVLQIDGTDGQALLGYAGLGASLAKTQPSDWMNDLLVGKEGLTVEQQLGIIADATKSDMPPELSKLVGPQAHHLLASALVNDEPRLYAVTLQLAPPTVPPHFVFTRYVTTESGESPPRFAFAGSGMDHLPAGRSWSREILRVVRAVEAGRVSPLAVADRLARVNESVAAKDSFVSRQCIVVWRFNGGSYQFYDGSKRTRGDMTLPNVGYGVDFAAFAEALMPIAFKNFEAIKKGESVDEQDWGFETLDKFQKSRGRKL
jgi:hypothetical protein